MRSTPADLDAVRVHDLTAHQCRGVECLAEHPHVLEEFESAWLNPDGFRVLPRFVERVDYST